MNKLFKNAGILVCGLSALRKTVIGMGIGLALSLQASVANAGLIEYATAVTSTSGSFGGVAADTLGAPDDQFIQLAFNSYIVLDFGSSMAPSSVQLIYTFDQLFPAFADISVSNDNSVFTFLGNTSDAVANDTASFNVTSAFRYVKVEDDGLGDADYPLLGFDLDAVGRMTVPEPSTLLLLGLGFAGLSLTRRRQLKL